jgi:hypothetical protein
MSTRAYIATAPPKPKTKRVHLPGDDGQAARLKSLAQGLALATCPVGKAQNQKPPLAPNSGPSRAFLHLSFIAWRYSVPLPGNLVHQEMEEVAY